MVDNIKKRLTEVEKKTIRTNEKGLVPLMNKKTDMENSAYIEEKYGKIKYRQCNESFEENSYGLGEKVGAKITLNKQIRG